MKAIILAAGFGKRMRPLTDSIPKPLVVIRGKTFLDWTLEALLPEVREVIIVVGYRGDQIVSHVKENYPLLESHFIVQEELSGTGGALLLVKSYINPSERFIVCYSDEYFTNADVKNCLQHEFSWLSLTVEHPERGAVPTLDENGKVLSLIEKPEHPQSNVILGGMMVINDDIFEAKPERHANGEYYLPDMMLQFIQSHDVFAVRALHNYSFATAEEIDKFNKEEESKG